MPYIQLFTKLFNAVMVPKTARCCQSFNFATIPQTNFESYSQTLPDSHDCHSALI